MTFHFYVWQNNSGTVQCFEIKLKGHLDINYSWPTYKFHNYEAMKPIIYTIL